MLAPILDCPHCREGRCSRLHDTPRRQLLRALGPFTDVHAEARCGTVRDAAGRLFDWWVTDETLPSGSGRVRLEPAS